MKPRSLAWMGIAVLAAGIGGPVRTAAASGSSPPPAPGTRGGPDLPRAALHALGDSTAAGVGARAGSYVERVRARLARAGVPVVLFNLSESGATAADVMREQVPRIGRGPSRLVLVSVGVND